MNFEKYSYDVFFSDNVCSHYFAAANSSEGFKSFFSDAFNPKNFDRIYILKGGPGVGKSTLMKNVAAKCKEHGFSPICYHCSSDPFSLDGIVIKEKKCAILDGTFPHTTDPTCAGVKEIIINMGTAWDTDALYKNGKEILSLIKEKSDCYSAAYKFLAAEKQLLHSLFDMTNLCLDKNKMNDDIDRKFTRLSKNKTPTQEICTRITRANSCIGDARLFSFEKQAKTIYFLKDFRKISYIYLENLYEKAKKEGQNFYVSFDPTLTHLPDAIYFPDSKVCFSLYDDSFCLELDKKNIPFKIINTKRFCVAQKASLNKTYYRFGEKCAKQMHESALSYLQKAGSIHEKIEMLYSKATNYMKVSEISGSVTDKIL